MKPTPSGNEVQSGHGTQNIRFPAWALWAGIVLISALAGFLLSRASPIAWGPRISAHDWPMGVSVIAWILFSIYWEGAAKNVAVATVSESRPSRWFHLLLVSAAQILIFLSVFGGHLLSQRWLPESLIVIAAGLTLLYLGLLLAIWARQLLGRNWSGNITIKVEHQLIRGGPYRFVRHPIYTGLLLMYAGVAIVSGELHALIGLALILFAYLRKIRLEEANLMNAFGADYSDFRRETWALFPGLF